MSTLFGAASADQHTSYRELFAAIRAGYLTAEQIKVLCEILLQLHVASRLLDEATAPGAFPFMRADSYRHGVAESAIRAFRHQLAVLADPHTSPAAPDPGLFEAGAVGSSLAQPSRSDAVGGLDATGSASDAWPGAGGAEPQPAHPLELGAR